MALLLIEIHIGFEYFLNLNQIRFQVVILLQRVFFLFLNLLCQSSLKLLNLRVQLANACFITFISFNYSLKSLNDTHRYIFPLIRFNLRQRVATQSDWRMLSCHILRTATNAQVLLRVLVSWRLLIASGWCARIFFEYHVRHAWVSKLRRLRLYHYWWLEV